MTVAHLERRGSERVALAGKNMRIRLADSHGRRNLAGMLRDVSVTGSTVVAELPELAAGTEVMLELVVPSWLGRRRLSIPATLLRSEPETGRHAFGFRLDDSSSIYRRLSRFVARAAEARGAAVGMQSHGQRVAESLRMAQAGILSTETDGPKVIVVTSPVASEGKELVASGLAALSAQEGKRILAVDADFTNPSLHFAFDVPAHPGLSDWLASSATGDNNEHASISDFATRSAGGIAVVTAGRRAGRKTEPSSRKLVAALRKFDFALIIINAPPLLVAAGAGVLAGASDDVVLVARSGVSLERQLVEARDLLRRHDANVRGVVLTDHADVFGEAPPGVSWSDRWSKDRIDPETDGSSGDAHSMRRNRSEMFQARGALRLSEDER